MTVYVCLFSVGSLIRDRTDPSTIDRRVDRARNIAMLSRAIASDARSDATIVLAYNAGDASRFVLIVRPLLPEIDVLFAVSIEIDRSPIRVGSFALDQYFR